MTRETSNEISITFLYCKLYAHSLQMSFLGKLHQIKETNNFPQQTLHLFNMTFQ